MNHSYPLPVLTTEQGSCFVGVLRSSVSNPSSLECLTENKNDQLGAFAYPSDTVESEASKSDVGPGSPDPVHQAPDGPGVQIKSEAEA